METIDCGGRGHDKRASVSRIPAAGNSDRPKE